MITSLYFTLRCVSVEELINATCAYDPALCDARRFEHGVGVHVTVQRVQCAGHCADQRCAGEDQPSVRLRLGGSPHLFGGRDPCGTYGGHHGLRPVLARVQPYRCYGASPSSVCYSENLCFNTCISRMVVIMALAQCWLEHSPIDVIANRSVHVRKLVHDLSKLIYFSIIRSEPYRLQLCTHVHTERKR